MEIFHNKKPHIDFCRDLEGPEKSEYIDMVLDDYNFSLEMAFSPKTKMFHRELLSKLVKTFGH
jgi:hypothetical protein|tara:strand:+ start:783 stop:971 length:189 start_codon:yes stop_codon:yes gene_type:complete